MDILNIENWKIISAEETLSKILVVARYEKSVRICVRCGASRQKIIKHGWQSRSIRDIPIREKEVLIELFVQRYWCLLCKRTFTLNINGLSSKFRLTERFVEYVAKRFMIFNQTFVSVSRDTNLSETLIKEIVVTFVENQEKCWTFPPTQTIGMDGVYIQRKERLIITDITNKRVISLHFKATTYEVEKALLDIGNLQAVKYVIMDMSRALYSAVKTISKLESVFSQPVKIVIDRYHIQRMINQAICNYLSSTKIKSKSTKTKTFTRNRFLLLRRHFDLTESERTELERWLFSNPELANMYYLKERFLLIWQHTDKGVAITCYSEWKKLIPSSLSPFFKKLTTAFTNWKDEIFNFFECRFTNAFTESANNLIKLIQRQSRGCSFYVVRAKILHNSYEKISPEMRTLPRKTNNYEFFKPKKTQRNRRLKRSQQHTSEVHELLFPKEQSWLKRFEPYLKIIDKEESGDED